MFFGAAWQTARAAKRPGGTMKKVVFIISGGELLDPAFLREQAMAVSPAAIICADGGARHVDAARMLPDLIVGDMDSLDPKRQADYEAKGCRVVRHPRQKDETDTELALHEAFRAGATEIWIWGALGFRIDHALANIALLFQGKRKGVDVKLVDEWCEVSLIGGRTVLAG